jgi:hypothetical protein
MYRSALVLALLSLLASGCATCHSCGHHCGSDTCCDCQKMIEQSPAYRPPGPWFIKPCHTHDGCVEE